MGLLDEQLAADAEAFVDADTFGETVTYTPVSGSPVSIKAVIVRDPPDGLQSPATAMTPVMDAYIRNDATYGRTSINTGGDTITVAYRKGGTTAAFAVRQIIAQDAGMWHVRLR